MQLDRDYAFILNLLTSKIHFQINDSFHTLLMTKNLWNFIMDHMKYFFEVIIHQINREQKSVTQTLETKMSSALASKRRGDQGVTKDRKTLGRSLDSTDYAKVRTLLTPF